VWGGEDTQILKVSPRTQGKTKRQLHNMLGKECR
jgi:hypothetical protein